MGFRCSSLRGLIVVVALGSLPVSSPVWAQPQAAAVSAERLEKARKHMEEGQALYAQKKYSEAAQAFQLAYTAQPFAAFLFNEAVCYEKAGEVDKALATFQRYLAADPNPPDADALKARIKRLEELSAARRNTPSAPTPTAEARPEAMHSLLVFESNPAGAPAQVWQKSDPSVPPFAPGGDNPGWKVVASGPTPLVATLVPGRYHVAVERWRAYNRSDDDVDVATGRVVQYRAGLSQGDFMGFFKVTVDDVDNAQVFLDDPPPHRKKPWGVAPHGELIPKGEHKVWVEAPGYEPYVESFTIDTGQQKTLQPTLERLGYGFLLIDGNASSIQVSVDGQDVGVFHPDDGPLRVKVPRGTHRIKATAADKKTYQGDIEVPAGQNRDVHLVLSTRPSRAAGWGFSVASAVTLGAGIYLGLKSNSVLDELRADRRAGRLAPDDTRIKDGRTYAIVADIGFSASVLFAGVAAFEFLRDPTPPSTIGLGEPREMDPPRDYGKRSSSSLRPSWQLAPAFSSNQGGLLFRGAF